MSVMERKSDIVEWIAMTRLRLLCEIQYGMVVTHFLYDLFVWTRIRTRTRIRYD